LHENAQFPFGNDEFRGPTCQTNCKIWKHPDNGFVQAIEPGEVDGNFTVERTLTIGSTSLADHCLTRELDC